MCILLLFWFTVLAGTTKIIKKFKLSHLNFNNNCILTDIMLMQPIYITQPMLMLNYIMEHKLSGWVNLYHAWLKNIVSWRVTSLCPIMLSSPHLSLLESAYIYSSASFLVTAWRQHFCFKMILRLMTSIELLLHAEYYCKHTLVFLPYKHNHYMPLIYGDVARKRKSSSPLSRSMKPCNVQFAWKHLHVNKPCFIIC